MGTWQEPRDAGASALAAFLALGAVAIVVILVVLLAAMAFPRVASPVAVPGIGSNVTGATGDARPANVTNGTGVTPTPSPRPLRLVVGEGVDPTPAPTVMPDDGLVLDPGTDKTPHHIAYAFQPNVSGIADFTAFWTIPQRPLYDGGPKHTIFLWTGVQQGNSGLVQCVLEWDHDDTGKYWTLACWAVDAKDQSYDVSPRIDAYPGDRIKAELRYETDAADPGRKVWHLLMTDETHEVTTELIDDKGAIDTNRDVILFCGVLEGIGPVSNGDDLPGDVAFEDMTYKDENGQALPVYLSGNVDPKFGHVAVEYDDSPTGSQVIIHTNYSS
jgi:hypothetical protein